MKPISPFPEGVQSPQVEGPTMPGNSGLGRYYTPAAWAFIWSPVLLVGIFYAGDASHRLLPIVKPLFALVLAANPLVLSAALIVLALSGRESRGLFISLNAAVLLLEIVGLLFLVAGSSRIYQ